MEVDAPTSSNQTESNAVPVSEMEVDDDISTSSNQNESNAVSVSETEIENNASTPSNQNESNVLPVSETEVENNASTLVPDLVPDFDQNIQMDYSTLSDKLKQVKFILSNLFIV